MATFQACSPNQKLKVRTKVSVTLRSPTAYTGCCGTVKQEVNADAHKRS